MCSEAQIVLTSPWGGRQLLSAANTLRIHAFVCLLPALIFFSCQSKETASKTKPLDQLYSRVDTTVALPDSAVANAYFSRAGLLDKATNYDSASFCYEKALQLYLVRAVVLEERPEWERYIRCKLGIARNLLKLSKPDTALALLTETLEVGSIKIGPNHPDIAATHTELANIHLSQDRYDLALEHNASALAIVRDRFGENHARVANSYELSGDILRHKPDYDRALEFHHQALSIRRRLFGDDHPDVAHSYDKIGYMFANKGDYERAVEYYKTALGIKRRLFGESHPEVAESYYLLADGLDYRGDYDRALDYYQKAAALYQEFSGESDSKVASSYHNIGYVYLQKKDYGKALEYLKMALKIKRQIFDENHWSLANTYGVIGRTLAGEKDYGSALKYHWQALSIRRNLLGNDAVDASMSQHDIASVYQNMGDYDKALEFYRKALDIRVNALGNAHPWVAATLRGMADVYCKQRDFENSLKSIDASILSVAPNYRQSEQEAETPFAGVLSEQEALRSLSFKASVLAKRYEIESHDRDDLQEAVGIYELALALIDRMRGGYKAEDSRLYLGELSRDIYAGAIEAALAVANTGTKATYRHEAFRSSERSKAGVLAQSLLEVGAKQFGGIPAPALAKERELRIELARYETLLQQEEKKKTGQRNTQEIAGLKSRLFSLQKQYDEMLEQFEEDYPDYYDLKYRREIASISDLQSALGAQTALIEYFVGDSSIHIFTLTHNAFEVTTVRKDSTFEIMAHRYVSSIKRVIDERQYVETSRWLYGCLIEPVAHMIAGKDRLVIIPDDVLHYLPLEALLTRESPAQGSVDFTRLDYLARHFEISYHYSATLWLKSHQKKTPRYTGLFVGFAPVFGDKEGNDSISAANAPVFEDYVSGDQLLRAVEDGESFKELKYSKQEVESIINMLQDQSGRHRAFFHRQASEENFKSNTAGYRYLHVATHGLVNEERPQLSALAFSQPNDSSTTEDGMLYAREAYNLELNADLVVLSSCESGLGKLVEGEGLMALTRGFLYSGARNIIVSLWKVYDEHTGRLMAELYRQIRQGQPYPAALHAAKLKMLEEPATAHPKLWSSFVLIGR